MKKTKLVAILLLIALTLTLSSCALGDWILGLGSIMKKITKAMDGISSFHMEGEVSFTVYAMGKTVEIDGVMEKIFIEEDDFCFYSAEDVTTNLGKTETKDSTMEAFLDGKYFFEASYNDSTGRFYSEHEQDVIVEYYKNVLADNENLLEGYESLEHTKNDDGTHTVVLSSYDSDTVNSVNTLYGFPLESDGAVVRDCVVTVQTDKEYRITRVETEYIFSDTSAQGRQTVRCMSYGNAQMKVDRLAVENYTKVVDARILPTLSRLLAEKKTQSEGSLTYTDLREATVSTGNSAQVKAMYKVNYGQGEDGYYFDIDLEMDNEQRQLTYAEGVYRVDGEVPEWSRITNDIEAKALIYSCIDFCGFHPAMVKDVTVLLDKNGYKSYELTLNEKESQAKAMLTELLGSVGLPITCGKNVSFCVVMENDELKEVSIDVAGTNMQQVSGQLIKIEGSVYLRVKFH